MAIIKILFRKNVERVLRYAFGHSQPGDPKDSEYCPPNPEGAAAEFKMVRDQYRSDPNNNEAIHVIQSWNESDSQRLTPETINGMGKALASEYFPGHQYAIVTHTETGKIHNHIVINTVNLETGKMVPNKYKHLHELRKINDRLCLEKGLTVPNLEASKRRSHVPQKVQQMIRAGKQSWVWDLKNKVDVARSLATSYDQYTDYLDALGVKGRVEEKNITYFYPGRSRGKRGDKLGKNYDKVGLEEQFKKNDERFQSKPEIRSQLFEAHRNLTPDNLRAVLLKDQGSANIAKDYSRFTKQSRKNSIGVPASERELTPQIIPTDEIRRAKRSILDYCKENKIGLSQNEKGQSVLKGKEYIVIHGDEATNTRNGTRANLIDFVAAHRRSTLLQAVAHINGTSHALTFEENFGAVERKYTSFYIPKPDQMGLAKATEKLSSFLRFHRASPRVADSLLKSQRAEVSTSGVIRLFAESDPGGALEFSESKEGGWSEKKQGTFQRPFYKRAPRSNRLFVYTDPVSYLSASGADALSERGHRDGILVLMEPKHTGVEHYLSENPGIRKLHVIGPKGHTFKQQSLDFFGVLKENLAHKGIEMKMESHERGLSHEGQGLSL